MSNKIKIMLAFGVVGLSLNTIKANDANKTFDQNAYEKSVHATIKSIKKEELNNIKIDALKLGQPACILSTYSDDPSFKVVNSTVDEIKMFDLGCIDEKTQKNRGRQTIEDLENIIPLQLTTLGYGSNIKYNAKYPGKRKEPIAVILEKLFLPEKQYKGKVIVDEYTANYPMWFVLNSADEFKAISKYLQKNFDEINFRPSKKTLLVLTILNDPKLETLDRQDKEFISKYFNLFPLSDLEVKYFFEKAKDILISKNLEMKNTKPIRVGESVMEEIFREIEDKHGSWKLKNGVVALAVGTVSALMLFTLSKEVNVAAIDLFETATGIKHQGTWYHTFKKWEKINTKQDKRA